MMAFCSSVWFELGDSGFFRLQFELMWAEIRLGHRRFLDALLRGRPSGWRWGWLASLDATAAAAARPAQTASGYG